MKVTSQKEGFLKFLRELIAARQTGHGHLSHIRTTLQGSYNHQYDGKKPLDYQH
jgi:hypothetical protein